jgi:hypothetical protein
MPAYQVVGDFAEGIVLALGKPNDPEPFTVHVRTEISSGSFLVSPRWDLRIEVEEVEEVSGG